MHQSDAVPPRLLRRREAAEFLGLSEDRLATLASNGRGPRFLKVPGGRAVLYRMQDLIDWLGEPVRSTSEAAARDRELAAA